MFILIWYYDPTKSPFSKNISLLLFLLLLELRSGFKNWLLLVLLLFSSDFWLLLSFVLLILLLSLLLLLSAPNLGEETLGAELSKLITDILGFLSLVC